MMDEGTLCHNYTPTHQPKPIVSLDLDFMHACIYVTGHDGVCVYSRTHLRKYRLPFITC